MRIYLPVFLCPKSFDTYVVTRLLCNFRYLAGSLTAKSQHLAQLFTNIKEAALQSRFQVRCRGML